jgi:hypothetical protein
MWAQPASGPPKALCHVHNARRLLRGNVFGAGFLGRRKLRKEWVVKRCYTTFSKTQNV